MSYTRIYTALKDGMLRVVFRLSGGLVVECPGVAPGRRILLRAYSRVALYLSLDGSVCPRQGVLVQAGEVRKEVPRIAARGKAVKKGLQGMKGGMGVIGNNNGR